MGEYERLQEQFHEMERKENEKLFAVERQRWIEALKELGFTVHPGVSVKENLSDFANWWHRKEEARTRNHGQVDE